MGIVVSTAALLASLLVGGTASVGLALDDQAACGVHPLDVVLVIDRSGSMQSEQSGDHTRNYWSELAANQLVDALDGGVGNVGLLHRVGLTTFGGTTASVDLALGSSHAGTVHGAIDAIVADGTTPLKLGMATGAGDLAAHQRSTLDDVPVLQVAVLISDGRPNPDGQRPDGGEIAAYLASADVAYSIAIGEGGSDYSQVDLDLMQGLANPAANFRHVSEASDLPGLFADIFTELTCPQIGVEKTPSVETLDAPGGEVTYSYAVTNSNPDAPLASVSVSDDKCSPVSYLSGDDDDDGRLQSDETWTFSCTAWLGATTTNVATASGEYNGVGFAAQDAVTVVVAEATPTPTPTETPTPTPTPTETETPAPTPSETETPGPPVHQSAASTPPPTEALIVEPDLAPVPAANRTPDPATLDGLAPVVAAVLDPPPPHGPVLQPPAAADVAADSWPFGAVLAAVAEHVTRVVKPQAAVAVAATFGFPLVLTLAVVLFLVLQGRADSRDPKLREALASSADSVVPFEDEERL